MADNMMSGGAFCQVYTVVPVSWQEPSRRKWVKSREGKKSSSGQNGAEQLQSSDEKNDEDDRPSLNYMWLNTLAPRRHWHVLSRFFFFFFFFRWMLSLTLRFFVVVQLVFFHMITCELFFFFFFFKDVIVHLHVGASFILLLTLFVEIRHVWGMLFFSVCARCFAYYRYPLRSCFSSVQSLSRDNLYFFRRSTLCFWE